MESLYTYNIYIDIMYINTDNYLTQSEILEAIGIPYDSRRIESWDPQRNHGENRREHPTHPSWVKVKREKHY